MGAKTTAVMDCILPEIRRGRTSSTDGTSRAGLDGEASYQLSSEKGKEADQHRSSVESDLLKIMEQNRHRKEEDLECKAMIPRTQSDMPPGKAAYHRRRVSGFKFVMLFDDIMKWDYRTAQLEERRRRLSPLHLFAVDQSDSNDGWRDGNHCPRPSIERLQIIDSTVSLYIVSISSCSGCHKGATEVDTEMQKQCSATRTATESQPTVDHMRWRNTPDPKEASAPGWHRQNHRTL